jgi:uroporphyrin-3 C-methyltransferase
MTTPDENDPKQDSGDDDRSATRSDDESTTTPGEDDQKPESGNDAPGVTEDQPRAARSGSGRLAFFSLVVALLAAAGTAYIGIEFRAQQALGDRVGNFQAGLSARDATLDRLAGEVASMTDDAAGLKNELDRLATQVGRHDEEYPARITRLEETVDKIPGVARQARSAWLRAEAEYFLRIANAQLDLAGNVNVAIAALDLADEKLKAIGDPALTKVRALISDERVALNAVPRPDTEGIMLTLASIARSLDTLPLARQVPDQFGNRRSTDKGESGFERAWRVIVDALKNIVSVRRDDEAIAPLMSESDESLLIRSLDIELQIARLAVIRGEAQTYRHSLEAVLDRLERYFEADSPAVIAAHATVTEMLQVELPETLPDISGSLALLVRVGNEAAAP